MTIRSVPITSLLLAVLATATPALAASPADVERAERLFQEGKTLMGERRFAEACPKLAESQRIDPANGTLLALALCHVGEGRIATAVEEFKQALPAARDENRRDRVELAQTHIAELGPRVPTLTLKVPQSARSGGFVVTLDGETVDPSRYDVAMPVDPGEHVLEAKAADKSWRMVVNLAEREAKVEDVPNLAESAGPGRTTSEFPMRTVGITLVSVGGVALISSAIFGFSAINKNSEAEELCSPSACDSSKGMQLNEDARSAATLSTVLFVVGALAAGGGAALVVLSSPKRSASAAPMVGPGLVGLSGRLAF